MTSKLLTKDKDIVIPGEELAQGLDYLPGPGTYRDKDAIVASRLGLVTIEGKAIKLIILSGKYSPKAGDVIIGKIIDVSLMGWRVDINCAYTAMLSVKDATSEFIVKGADLTRYFDLDEYIVAGISNVTSQKLVDLTLKGPGLHKLHDGRIIEVNPNKVPRIIGKAGSMVTMIKEATKTRITVGQNGLVHVQGEPKDEIRAVKAIKMIEEESHISGLTDKIKDYLDKVKENVQEKIKKKRRDASH